MTIQSEQIKADPKEKSSSSLPKSDSKLLGLSWLRGYIPQIGINAWEGVKNRLSLLPIPAAPPQEKTPLHERVPQKEEEEIKVPLETKELSQVNVANIGASKSRKGMAVAALALLCGFAFYDSRVQEFGQTIRNLIKREGLMEFTAAPFNNDAELLAPEDYSLVHFPELAELAQEGSGVERLHTFLSEPTEAVDDSTYAHLIGHGSSAIRNGRVAGIPLEGHLPEKILNFHLGIAKSLLKSLQQVPHSSSEETHRCCEAAVGEIFGLRLSQQPELIPALIDQLEEAQRLYADPDKIREAVAALEPGKSFFFPAVWRGRSGGHAMAWHVTKQLDGKLTVRLYNTGAGINYHTNTLVGLDERFLHFTEVVNVEPEQLTSDAVRQAIKDPNQIKLPDSTDDWDGTDFYRGVLLGLGGEISSRQVALTEANLPQFVGICAMESVMAVIQQQMGTVTAGLEYRFWTTLKGTINYFEKIKTYLVGENGSEERRRLMGDGIKTLAGLANKAASTHAITHEELAYTTTLIEQIRSHLKAADIETAAKTIQNEPQVSFTVPLNNPLQQGFLLDLTGYDESVSAAPLKEFVPIQTDSLPLIPSTVAMDLQTLKTKLHEGNHVHHNYLEVQRALRSAILRIPLNEEMFWNLIDDATAASMLSTLSVLSQEFLWSFLHNNERLSDRYALSSDDYLCMQKILAISDKIVHNYQNPQQLKIPSLFQSASAWARLDTSPEWEKEETSIQHYWEESMKSDPFVSHHAIVSQNYRFPITDQALNLEPENHYDLFGFDLYPAGNTGEFQRIISANEDFLTIQSDKYQVNIPREWSYGKISTKDVQFLAQWAATHRKEILAMDRYFPTHFPFEDQALRLLEKQWDQMAPFKDAFTISYIYNYFLTGSFSAEQKYDFSKGIQIHYDHFEKTHYAPTNKGVIQYDMAARGATYSLFGKKPKISDQDHERLIHTESSPDYLKSGANLRAGQIGDLGTELTHLFLNDLQDLKQKEGPFERVRMFSNTALVLHPNKLAHFDNFSALDPGEISVEKFREILALSNRMDLQIPQTLGFFSYNPHLLLKSEYQLLFRALMTEGTLLNDWIKESPTAAQDLSAFYKEILDGSKESGEADLEIFISGMAYRLEEIVGAYQIRNRLNEIIQNPTISDAERAAAHLERLLTFRHQGSLTPEEIGPFLGSFFYARIHSMSPTYEKDPGLIREAELLMRNRFSKSLIAHMQSSQRDSILNQALQENIPDAALSHWKEKKFPLFVSADGRYEIDVLNGDLKVFGRTPTSFNRKLLEYSQVAEAFGTRIPSLMIRIDDRTVEVELSGHSIRITELNEGIYSLAKKIRGQWYHFVTHFDGKMDNQAMSMVGTGVRAWASPAGEIIVEEINQDRPLYRLILSNNREIKEGIVLDEAGNNTDLRIVNSKRPELDPFKRLESADYILPLAHKDGRLVQVNLPRYRLTFNIKGDRAISEELSGFGLTEGAKQHLPHLGDMRNYLHLTRKERDGSVSERVIFPAVSLEPFRKGPYLTETASAEIREIDSLLHLEYDVKGERLVPTATRGQRAIAANLFLAMIHLAERHPLPSDDSVYAQAKYYLDQADRQISLLPEALSEICKSYLDQIIELDTGDSNPNGVALRLKAFYLSYRDSLDYQQNNPFTVEKIAELIVFYKNYLTHHSRVDLSLRLAPHEEMELLGIAPKEGVFLSRFNQLTKDQDIPTEFAQSLSIAPIMHPKLDVETLFPVNTVQLTWIEQLLIKMEDTWTRFTPGVMLRDIHEYKQFADYYAIAKGEMDPEKGAKFLKSFMGLSLTSTEDLKEEFITALKMNIGVSRKDPDFAKVSLLAVALYPERFDLSSDELRTMLARLMELKNIRELPRTIASNRELAKIDSGWLEVVKDQEEQLAPYESELNGIYHRLETKIVEVVKELAGELGIEMNSAKSEAPPISAQLARERSVGLPTLKKKTNAFQQSVNLDRTLSAMSLNVPVVSINERMVQFRTLAKTGSGTQKTLFQVSAQNPLIGKIFEEAQTDLTDYISEKTDTVYEWVDVSKFLELQETLRPEIEKVGAELIIREENLLALAHKGPSSIGEIANRKLEILRGAHQLLTLDDLVRGYYSRDIEKFHQRNPNLTKNEIRTLFNDVESYLYHATYLQQLQRVYRQGEYLMRDLDDPFAMKAYVAAATAKRGYDPRRHPEYLVFEYYGDLLIWPEQVQTLEAMTKTDQRGALKELAMGMGKSHLISPLLEWLDADGEQIAISVMPDALVPSMAKSMQATFGHVFDQKVRVLPIKRDPTTVKKRMERLHRYLKEIQTNKQALIWTANDLQSLFNQWIEFNESQLGSISNEYREQHALFMKIFHLLRSSGRMRIDEIHEVFNILKSHSFTFGLPQEVHHDTSSAMTHLFEAILETADVHWEFLPGSKGDSFTEETYHSSVKPKLIETLLNQRIDPRDSDFKDFFAQISQTDRQSLAEYLSGGKNGYDFLQKLDRSGAQKIRNQFADLKEALNIILPRTAGKKSKVHFTLDHKQRLVIPAHDGKPAENNIFGNVLERLIYAAQYDLSQGVPDWIVFAKIEELQNNYQLEKHNSFCPSLLEFQELTCGLKKYSLSRLTQSDREEIARIVRSNPGLELKLIKQYRYPEIKVYPKEIESSAHILPLLAKPEQGVSGMTGTLFNDPTYPTVFQSAQLSDTQTKILNILLEKSSSRVPIFRDLESILHGSILDATGNLSQPNNEELARAVLSKAKDPITGVVYYDNDVLKVVTRENRHPIPYDRSMNPEKLAAVWGVTHMTGSDIPVAPFTQATMVVDKHITLVKLLQGPSRLRGLAKGQAVNFMVLEKDKPYISAMLKQHLNEEIDPTADLSLSQLIRYALLNQSLMEADNTYQSIRERMKMAFVQRITSLIWEKLEGDPERALAVYRYARNLFVTSENEEPWDQRGAPADEIPTPQALEKLLQRWKKDPLVNWIKHLGDSYFPGFDLPGLFADWDRIIHQIRGPLPETVKTNVPTYGKTAEKITEQNVDKRTDQQSERESQKEKETNLWEKPVAPMKQLLQGNPFLLEDTLAAACIPANAMVQTNPRLKANLFDENLLVSLNLTPSPDKTFGGDFARLQYQAFDPFQERCTFVEVIQEGSGNLKIKMIDDQDAATIRQYLAKDREKPSKNELKVGLMQIQKKSLNIDVSGSDPIDLNTPKTRGQFLHLLVQAKVASGILDYTAEELPYLTDWIHKSGPANALTLIDTILNPIARSDTRKSFRASPLAKTLEKAGVDRKAIAAIN